VRRENLLARKNAWRKQGSNSITWGVVVGEDNCGADGRGNGAHGTGTRLILPGL
jgi:hypothetical protein